jgi:hypothetical protein
MFERIRGHFVSKGLWQLQSLGVFLDSLLEHHKRREEGLERKSNTTA